MLLHEEITDRIIGAFYKVYNELGYGFLEKVYENGLLFEFEHMGLEVEGQRPIEVCYGGRVVGEYYADLCLEDSVIVEIKSAERLSGAHEAQLKNYLKATAVEVGLLLNFGPKPEFSRKVFTEKNPSLSV